MGNTSSRTFTESGIKRFYQYFIIYFCLLMFLLSFIAIIPFVVTTGSFLLTEFTEGFYFVIVISVEIFILFILIWAVSDFVLGRKEFGEKHEFNVVIGSILLVPSIFLYLIKIVLPYGLVDAFSSSLIFRFNSYTMDGLILITIIISILLPILMGLGFYVMIRGFVPVSRKTMLLVACVLLVVSPFSFTITGLIAYILFFICYRDTYGRFEKGDFKTITAVPCPYCNRNIPIESKVCPYCNKEFKIDETYDIIEKKIRF